MQRLRIYDVALVMVREVAAVARRVERRDRDLARQMRRSSTAVALNISKGTYARGGNKPARYQTAMAEAAETSATIESAAAAGYIPSTGHERTLDRLDHIAAVMWKLTH
jgi:four helix bundle protein